MSFRCASCNKVTREGRMVVMATHEVVQYDRYHKREVRSFEIEREVRCCLPCAAGIEETPLENPLGKVRSKPDEADKAWLVEAIEANAPEEE